MSLLPSVNPSLNLQFHKCSTPAEMLSLIKSVGGTFDRSSEAAETASFVNKFGEIEFAPANYPRPDFDPLTGENKGILIEESRTNILDSAENLYGWSPTRAALELNAAASPEGKKNASTIRAVEDGANDYIAKTTVVSGGIADKTITFSVYIKSNSGAATATLFMYGNSGIEEVASNANIQITSEWTRYSVTQTFSAGAVSGSVVNRVDIRTNGNSNATAGHKIDVYGAQTEIGSFTTSYIKPNTAFTSRASTATYFDSAGVLQTAAIDEARSDAYGFDEDGSLVPIGLLLEESRTNSIPYSKDLNNSAWLKSNVTISHTNGTAPDGTAVAQRVQETADSSQVHNIQEDAAGLTANATYTGSAYLNPSGRHLGTLRVRGNGYGNGFGVGYDLTNETVTAISNFGTGTYLSSGIEKLNNGWFRVYVTGVPASAGSGISLDLRLKDAANQETYNGDGASGVYVWGVQIEAGSYPTSYIPTAGSAVTRSADVSSSSAVTRSADDLTISGTAFSDFYNQEAGTWIAVAKPFTAVTAGSSMLFHVYTDADDRYSVYSFNDRGYIYYQVDSGVISTVTPIEDKELNEVKIAITQPEKGKFFIDGVEQELNQNNEIPVHSLSIGFRGYSGTSYFNGQMKSLVYFPKALTDAELQLLTR